jgi:hypothetical protein
LKPRILALFTADLSPRRRKCRAVHAISRCALGAGEYHRLCFYLFGFFGIAPRVKQARRGAPRRWDARWGPLHDRV